MMRASLQRARGALVLPYALLRYQAFPLPRAHSTSALNAAANYERVVEKTLQSLFDQFDSSLPYASLWEKAPNGARVEDCEYSHGVLTLSLVHATAQASTRLVYVLNKQPPNRQIWLSSPVSGPKRFDCTDLDNAPSTEPGLDGGWLAGHWKDKRDGTPLDKLLSQEFSSLFKRSIVIQ